ncbi:hypothetical protein JIN85_17455 [Luteolibacter pohnpeiensis]|uniref:Uncharacterized protein n=1 Tax=Luteolibacter pohnpeiensis TaxID=454153 RepID=A0A934VXC2_9BACT|nr:hypothetical protein [Luteolibacter pohnpeiensis]MBK1884210.1 hypothetical protein [Luteolibacter pohnpeiensis]
MKACWISLIVSCLCLLPSGAVTFDMKSLGASLNGWDNHQTAHYSFSDTHYQTHQPTLTRTPSGGMFLSAQVDLISKGSAAAVCHLGLTFSSAGVLESAQVKGTISGKSIDTGLIRRPDAPQVSAAEESAEPPRPFHATDELINEVFVAFDGEMEKALGERKKDRKDLISRIFTHGAYKADLSAGLRHNLNLILQSVHD